MMNKQRMDFEAYVVKTQSRLLIAVHGAGLSQAAAENIIKATWLPHHPEDGEFKAQATLDMFEMWKAAQACVVVELPKEGTLDGDGHFYDMGVEACSDAIIAAGGTVKR